MNTHKKTALAFNLGEDVFLQLRVNKHTNLHLLPWILWILPLKHGDELIIVHL